MTLSEIQAKITFLTGADTTSFAAADRVNSINNAIDKITTAILASADEWDFDDSNKTDYPVGTCNLVANQQDYILPSTILDIKRVEVSYDGTNWYKMEPFDAAEYSSDLSDTSIASDFSTASPMYDIRANALFLYPVPTDNVTAGLKIWIDRAVTLFDTTDLSTGTKSPGFDRTFHELVPMYVAYDWKLAKNFDTNILKRDIMELEAKLKNYYGHKQQDRKMNLQGAYINYE